MEKISDNRTREILVNSQLELTVSDFENVVMQKIIRDEARKKMQRFVFLFCLVGLVIELLTFIAAPRLTGDIADLVVASTTLSLHLLDGAMHWLTQVQYILIPLIAVILIQKIISTNWRYSSKH